MIRFLFNKKHPIWIGKTFYVSVILILLVLVSGRLIKGNNDYSYFIVAGSDFVDSQISNPVIIQNGQGYDGQFFYRYALDPFSFDKTKHGITVDLPPYRLQRIAYPAFAWLFSFGGIPSIVPFTLILLNLIFFVGIIYFTRKFIYLVSGVTVHHYLPLLLCGLYMSLARDLSEICELFFFMGTIYYLFSRKYFLFIIFAAVTLLSRETSIIALLPIIGYRIYQGFRNGENTFLILSFCIPFILFFVWKSVVMYYTGSESLLVASQNLGIPFIGMINGFNANRDLSSGKNIFQFVFWILYFTWQIIFFYKVIKSIRGRPDLEGEILRPLLAAYLFWMLFAICFSSAIFSDDWSFVRVFSLWNMIGMLILILRRWGLGNMFKIYSLAIVLLTIARLIIRV